MNHTTHHHGCDCREEKVRELLHEIMAIHADHDNPGYNGCDTIKCKWCVEAERLVGALPKEKSCEQ